MSDVYGASDYAGMSGGKWSFYYGYELIWCPLAGFVDYVKHQDDCEREDDHQWAFVASYDLRTVVQYKASEIGAGMDIDTEVNVLRGIARMFDEIEVTPSAASDGERRDLCCETDSGPFVNDATMADIRRKYWVLNSVLTNVENDGKQIQHEISVAFREIRALRAAVGVVQGDPQ